MFILHTYYHGRLSIAGSPFTLKVCSRTDASKVRVSGPGLQSGLLATFKSDLLVETSGAGPGRLTVRVRGPKGLASYSLIIIIISSHSTLYATV